MCSFPIWYDLRNTHKHTFLSPQAEIETYICPSRYQVVTEHGLLYEILGSEVKVEDPDQWYIRKVPVKGPIYS